jgi:hypothetical protein
MRSTLFGVLIMLIMPYGCNRVTTNFVSVRDVPENPTFVVLPFNDYKLQIDFANIVESAFIASGVRVVQRPSSKEVEVHKNVEMKAQDKKGVI